MTDLSRDARALVGRVRRRDGASAEDCARLRHKLEASWAPQRADLAAGTGADAVTAVPVTARILQSTVAAVVLVSLGFLSPEAPRTLEHTDRQAPHELAPPPRVMQATRDADPLDPQRMAAASSAAESTDAAEPAEPKAFVHRSSASAERRTSAPKPLSEKRPTHRREHPRATVQAASPRPASQPPMAASSSALRTSSESKPPDGSIERVPVSEIPSDARAPNLRERSGEAASGGDVGPTVSDRSFEPQAIDDELAWLGAAQDALRSGQPTRALSLVQQHAFRFPRGALAPERAAVQALALCALERKQAARAVLADLARRAPSSPLVDRVRRSCGL